MKKLLRLLILSVFLTSVANVIAQTVYVNKTDSKYHLLWKNCFQPHEVSITSRVRKNRSISSVKTVIG